MCDEPGGASSAGVTPSLGAPYRWEPTGGATIFHSPAPEPEAGASEVAEPSLEDFGALSAWNLEARLSDLDGDRPSLATGSHGEGPSSEWDSLSEVSVDALSHGDASAKPGSHAAVVPPSLFLGDRAARMQQRSEESFIKPLPDVLPPERPFVAFPRPSTSFVTSAYPGSGTSVCDETGRVIAWPWESHPAGSAAQALPCGARQAHRTDSLRVQGMNASVKSGDMGRGSVGVRAWRAFCAAEATPHDRPIDPNSPLWVKLEEELLAMQFVCALVEDRHVTPDTAANYFGHVQGWHSKEHGIKLAAGMKLSRLPAMLKGLRRVVGQAPRAVRRGVAPAALQASMALLLPDLADPVTANIRAALSVALQGLLRSAEYACDPEVKWDSRRHLSRADLTECSETRLVLMMLPCKNMRHLSGKTCPLIIGAGGAFVDAVREVRNMLRVDPVPAHAAESTPLFRDPRTNEPLRTNHVRDSIRGLMAAVGEPDPSQFGTHSLRIGGATALFAAGADPTVIRTMGRWSSDCYRLYVRACFESTLKWSRLVGSTQVSDLAGEFDEVDFY